MWGHLYSNCLANIQCAAELFQYFGFSINFCKSTIIPSRKIEYLGVLLDSFNACLSLTEAKREKSLLFLSVFDKINSISFHFLHRLEGFFNFIFELVPYFKSFLHIWFNQLKSCKSSRLKFSRVPVQAIRDLLSTPNFYRSWIGGYEIKPLACFSDATPSRVAFVSDRCVFSKPLSMPLPILISEFLAGYACLLSHHYFSDNLMLCSDNLSVIYSIKKGSIKSALSNFILQNLAYFYLRAPYNLSLAFVPSIFNPADKFTCL